jgi:membrane protein
MATLIWLVISALFALYVTDFSSYNKTYGSLAGIVVFLVWLWLTNISLLFGLEINAELERQRAIAGGRPEDVEPFTEPRDTRKLSAEDRRDVARSAKPR